MKTLTIITLTLLLAACAAGGPKIWLRDATTQADFDRDKAECEFEAAKSANQRDNSFRSSLGQELELASRRDEIASLCLKAKGYVLKKN